MWLMPAATVVDLGAGSRRSSASCSMVPWTLWHRPTVRTGESSVSAQQTIAMGLT